MVYTGAGARSRQAYPGGARRLGPMIHPMGGAGRNPNEVILELGKPTIAVNQRRCRGWRLRLRWRAISVVSSTA